MNSLATATFVSFSFTRNKQILFVTAIRLSLFIFLSNSFIAPI